MIVILNDKAEELTAFVVNYVSYFFLKRKGGEWLEFEFSIILLYFHDINFVLNIVGFFGISVLFILD